MAQLNEKAFALRHKLFSLVNEFKDLAGEFAAGPGDVDTREEARQQIDSAGCRLAEIHETLGDVFIDAARDSKDQSFAVS